ncbi:MAG: 2-oxoacid:ferredoxin oxidoreductase subunit beta [Candidatus Bathyarchaeia archaeon]|jgi:2-oxoglutarate ferredoxin oxidoreductase subunit beta
MAQLEANSEFETVKLTNPRDEMLRADRLPHIWCPGCGLGIVTGCLVEAIRSSGIPQDRHVVVSGIGCTSRIPGYLNLDTYHTTHGRAIAVATGMKVANPELEVTVISGDGDLFNIGGNHLIHAIRRNVDLNIFCVNNFNYGMTGGQFGATTPTGAKTATTPYGNFEASFNIPYMVAAAGAPFVARWTALHVRQLLKAMLRAFQVQGLAFVEIVSPCPPTFGDLNNFEDALAMMQYFRTCSRVDDKADLSKIALTMKPPDPIVVGNFVDIKKPTYHEVEREAIEKAVSRSK